MLEFGFRMLIHTKDLFSIFKCGTDGSDVDEQCCIF